MIKSAHSSKKGLLCGLFLFLSACAHLPYPAVERAARLSCEADWETCLMEDIAGLAQASRSGHVTPWMQKLSAAIRRSRTQDAALLMRYFSPAYSLLDATQARQLIAALKTHDSDTVSATSLQAAQRSLERIWLGDFNQPPTLGELSSWYLVSGFESNRGAALSRVDPPQERFDLSALVTTPLGKRPWRQIRRARGKALIYPQDWTFPTRQRCHHLVSAFTLEVPGYLSLRGGNERRVWLNGKPLIEFAGLEGSLVLPVRISDQLRSGQHQLEIRSCPKAGSGSFQLLAHAQDGQLIQVTAAQPKVRLEKLSSSFVRFDAEQHVDQLYASIKNARLKRILSVAKLADLGRASDAIARLESIKSPGLAEQLMALQLAINNRRKELVMSSAKALGDDLVGQVWRANALLSLQQSDRAARLVLPRADEFKTLNRRAQIMLGKVIQNQAPTGASYRYWKTIADSSPSWPYAISKLRAQYAALGYTKQADDWFERIQSEQPGALDVLNDRRERAQQQRRFRDALELIDRKIQLDDLDIGRRITRANLLIQLDRFDLAQEQVNSILKQNPYSVGALRWMSAHINSRYGTKEAAPYLARLAGVRPDHSQVIRAERYQALRSPREEIRIPNWRRPSTEDIQSMIAQRAEYRPKKAVSQVLLIDDHLDLIQADGSRRQVVTIVRWFLDRRAAQRYLKINLSGLRNRQIHHAYLVQPNGQRVDPVSQRGGKIRFREIGPESVLVLQYESTSKPSRLINGLVEGTFWFEGSDAHAVRARFTLASARSDLDPRFTIVGEQPARKEVEKNGVKVWSFERQNVGPAVMEINVQAPWRYRSQVRFSTMSTWDPYVGWVRDLFRQSGKITPKLSKKAKALVSKMTSIDETIDTIYRFAVEEIQYEQDYARVIEGWEPHLPDQVLDRKYGDCKDKSMLIITMLRSLGIEAEPALIRTWKLGDIDRTLPGSQFNHAIVYLPKQPGLPKPRFLDATAEYLDRDNLRIDVQGTDALIIKDQSWSWVTVPARPANEEHTRIELEQVDDRLWKAKMIYRGHTAGMIRRVGKGDKQRFLMQNIVTGAFWPGSELVDGQVDEVGQRLQLTLTLRAPTQTVKLDGSIDLPLVVKRFWLRQFNQSERKLPLRLSSSRSTEVIIRSQRGDFIPSKRLQSASKLHSGSWSCTEQECRFSMIIKPLIIQAKDYAPLGQELRSFQTQLADEKLKLKQKI